MAKSKNTQTILKKLMKKVETLEDQGFAQKLLIDDLENKLLRAEEAIKNLKENPFGITSTLRNNLPLYTTATSTYHTCIPSVSDYLGNTYCVTCGVLMANNALAPNPPNYIVTSTYGDNSYQDLMTTDLSPDVKSTLEDKLSNLLK